MNMKSNFKKGASMLSLALICMASYVSYGNNADDMINSDILLSENVLALADANSSSGTTCYKSITCDDAEGLSVVYCPTCSSVPDAKSAFMSGTGTCG